MRAKSEVSGKRARCVKNSENLDQVIPSAVDDAIRSANQIPIFGPLRHDATRFRKVSQLINREVESLDHPAGMRRRVTPDELVDGCQIVSGLLSPPNLGHRPMRFLTSS